MASPPTHIVATAAIAAAFYAPSVPRHLWAAGAALAVAPDLDFVGYRAGIPYDHLLGHRGLTHSLFAAAALGLIFVVTVYRQGAGPLRWPRVWLFLFLAGASHGVLDALTNGGLGVAFFAPFANERHFFPFRPIEVSPLSIRRFLSPAGLAILWNEFMWVWCPTIVAAAGILWYRARRGPRDAPH